MVSKIAKEQRSKSVSYIKKHERLVDDIMGYICIDYESGEDIKETKTIQFMQKEYHILNEYEKLEIARKTSDLIREKSFRNIDIKINVYKFAAICSHENDWKHIKSFLENFFFIPMNLDLIKKFSDTLFSIIDDEFNSLKSENHVAGFALATITEIALFLESTHNAIESEKHLRYDTLIEHLTSNIISRSNITNDTMHLAIVYFLGKVHSNNKMNLQRVLGRFGHTLLDHVFDLYFNNKKKSHVAFYFLCDHLDIFLSSSPSLAESSNSILQEKMYSNPKKFIEFMNKYIVTSHINYNKLIDFLAHTLFLFRNACEVNNKVIIENMYQFIRKIEVNLLLRSAFYHQKYCEIVIGILSSNQHKKSKDFVKEIMDDIKVKIKKSRKTELAKDPNVISLDQKLHVKPLQSKIITVKSNHVEDKNRPSPLEEILLLVS